MKTSMSLAAVAGLALAGSANAAITVTGTQEGSFTSSSSSSFSVDYKVQNENSVVVVGFYIDGDPAAVTNLKFGTGTGDQAAAETLYEGRTSLGYFFNPDTAIDLAIRGDTGVGKITGYHIWELAGVDLNATVQNATGTSNSLSITTNKANEFIVDMLGVNYTSGTQDPDTGSDITKTFHSVYGGNAGGEIAGGFVDAATAGTYDLGWLPEGANYGEIALSFETVPEPSTTALLGLGGLTLLLRRQR